jgi:hypothetical protein
VISAPAKPLWEAFKKVKAAISYRNPHLSISNVQVKDGRIYASDGSMTASAPFPLDLEFTVQGEALGEVLRRGNNRKTEYEFELEGSTLVVRNGQCRSQIQTCLTDFKHHSGPEGDPMPVPEGFVEALRIVAPIMSPDRSLIYACGAFLARNAVYATNMIAIAEATHAAWESDVDITVPDWAVDHIIAREEKPCAVSYTPTTVSVSWDDGSWMVSSRYDQEMPPAVPALARAVSVGEEYTLSEDWREAFDVLSKGDVSEIIIAPGRMQCGGVGSIFEAEIDSLVSRVTYWNPKFLSPILKVATRFNPGLWPGPCPWAGEGCRGLIWGSPAGRALDEF